MTPYHCQYWTHLLAAKGAGSSGEKFSHSTSNARLAPSPHQVDAALFALSSPLPKGTILADEVGLRKTIEARIALVHRRAEPERGILHPSESG